MTAPLAPLLIALTGRKGAGKDTAARYLEDQYAFAPIAFAEPLLDMACALAAHADVDGAWCIEPDLKEKPMPVLGLSYRRLARSVADALRAIDADLFARVAAHRVRQALAFGSNVVITDLRYPNELRVIATPGLQIVRIKRHDAAATPADAHSSEQHTDHLPVHHVIDNSGSRIALYDQLDELVLQLRAKAAARGLF